MMRISHLVDGLAWTLLVAGALMIARPLRADEVHMKNGSVIKAKKIDKGEKVWKLTTDLGVIEVKAADVDKVVETRAPDPVPVHPKSVDSPDGKKGTDNPTAVPAERDKPGPRRH